MKFISPLTITKKGKQKNMDVSDLAGFCDDIIENQNKQIAELQCEVDYNNTVIEKYRTLVREYEQEIKQLKERLKNYE